MKGIKRNISRITGRIGKTVKSSQTISVCILHDTFFTIVNNVFIYNEGVLDVLF
jgi:hypothetical protein